MSTPVRRGRAFSPSDTAGTTPVALVNETLARRAFPGEDPIGRRIVLRRGSPVERQVVGIVADMRHTALDAPARPELFLPLAQYAFGSMTLVARAAVDPVGWIGPMQAQIWEMNPNQTVYSAATTESLLSESLREDRFRLWLLGSLAILALVLASVGIYGLMTYIARERVHEIGIGRALGASAADVLRMTMGQGLRLAMCGVGAAVVGALIVTRWLRTFLFDLSPADPLTFAALAMFVVGVAAVAIYVPARRAARVDPLVALRSE